MSIKKILMKIKDQLVGMRYENQDEYYKKVKKIIESHGLVFNYTDYDNERIYSKENRYLASVEISFETKYDEDGDETGEDDFVIIEDVYWEGDVMLNKNIKFYYTSYMEGDCLVTHVVQSFEKFGSEAQEKWYELHKAAREDADLNSSNRRNGSEWDGSHWDAPDVFASEKSEDNQMSDEMASLIQLLGAEYI